MPYKIVKEENEDISFVCVSCGLKTTARKYPNGILVFRSHQDLEKVSQLSDLCSLMDKFPNFSVLDYCTD